MWNYRRFLPWALLDLFTNCSLADRENAPNGRFTAGPLIMTLLLAEHLKKTYLSQAGEVSVLKGLEFSIAQGELVGIYGASGTGKSTFLHLLGGLDSPSAGRVVYQEQDLASLSSDKLALFRNKKIGFVFQFFHLLAEFNALENVMMPALIAGVNHREAKQLASTALGLVDLQNRALHRPAELSGGEQQRVAIARAVVMKPSIVLADEPTGNLDQAMGEQVWEYLLQLHQDFGSALVVVSHNTQLLQRLPKTHELKDGILT